MLLIYQAIGGCSNAYHTLQLSVFMLL